MRSGPQNRAFPCKRSYHPRIKGVEKSRKMLPTSQLLPLVSALCKADTTFVPAPDNGSWHLMPCSHSMLADKTLATWILSANMNGYMLRFCS